MTKNVFVSFDIDGTTVCFENNIGTHMLAFSKACEELFGPIGDPKTFLGYEIAGWMDRKILRNIIEKLGFEPSEENILKLNKRVEEIFEELFTQVPTVPKGMARVLKELSEMPNVTIGVASGNLAGVAWKKLKNAGLLEYFKGRVGGFGGDVLERVDAVKLSRENGEKYAGHKFDKWFHVGDMPNDANAAIAAGAEAIVVKTGGIAFDDSDYPQPSVIFENLEIGHDKFMELIK